MKSGLVLFPPVQLLDSRTKVVVTGAGIITALGHDWASNSTGFRQGKTAFRPVTLFDVSRQRVQTAAQADLPVGLPRGLLTKKQSSRLERAGKFLLWAGHQAFEQAGWTSSGPVPIILGTTSGGMSLGEEYIRQALAAPGAKRRQATRVHHYLCQRQGLDLAGALGLTGPVVMVANACASGANAIGLAFQWIGRGYADRILAGGYDALSAMVFSGFDSLQALSPTRCRPFDARRDGLAMGEGAAIFALETPTSAQSRGAEILGEICGYGASTDVHHLTQPQPEGQAAWQAMTRACSRAGLTADQIGYVNAHGTGTPLNDTAETSAINRWAGPRAPSLAVSSTKGSIGHLLGAAGAVEAMVCLMALREDWIPPTASLREPEPSARFRLVRQPEEARLEYALSNSFGFGGANASLILKRWD